MAINIIVGRPGCGKSYEAVVYHVIPALESGRKIITNLPLNLEHFKGVFGDSILDLIEIRIDEFDKVNSCINRPFSKKSDFLDCDWKNEDGQGPLYIIDECHFQYPTSGRGKLADGNLKDCLEHFSMHRHYGQDFLLMTQSLGKLNKDLRDMIQIQYEVSKHSALGSDKSYTQTVKDGASGRANKVSAKIRTYKPEFFKFYKSHTKTDKSVTEAHAQDLVPLWKQPTFKFAGLFLLIGIPWVLYTGSQLFSKEEEKNIIHSAPKTVVAVDKNVSRPASPVRVVEHPFKNMSISITGSSDSSYINNDGKWITQFDVYFEAKAKNGYLISMKLKDLHLAGYDVEVYGNCLAKLDYKGFSELIYCKGKKPENTNKGLASSMQENLGLSAS